MKILEIKSTKLSPYVYGNSEESIFKIVGRSLPEDPEKFYGEIIDWIEQFSLSNYDKLNVEFYLDYFNTASAKYLFTMISVLDNLKQSDQKKVSFKWVYEHDDETMLDLGQEFVDLFPNLIELVEDE